MENKLVVAKGSTGKDCCLSCLTVWDPMDCGLPGSSVLGILQARILEWAAISVSRGASWPRDQTQVSCIAGRFFTIRATREAFSGGGGGLTSYPLCLVQNTYPINICHTEILGTPCGSCFMRIFFLLKLIFLLAYSWFTHIFISLSQRLSSVNILTWQVRKLRHWEDM